MAEQFPEKLIAIGPVVPSIYLNNAEEASSNTDFNSSKSDLSPCIEWLNTKEPKSVLYVSFGSIFGLGEEQFEELAWGLKMSNMNFLWVVKPIEEHKLPAKFKEEIEEKGFLVPWCPQLQVLAHEAVGCFVTHCGWNSTIEALSLGVPMVAMPQFLDQTTGAKFVEDVWRVGVRVKKDEKGIVRRGEFERCINEVMHGMKSEEIQRNAVMWKDLAREAMSEGGSSDRNIERFVSKISCS